MASQTKTNLFYKIYRNVTTSIAFVPTIIATMLFLLALLTLFLDQFTPDSLLTYHMQIKNILYPDSARALLGAIAGGTISLMVFSFSMVMVVLNQTASNYSPRVLPSLIGNKFHQLIMGVYLGTISFTFMVLSSIQSKVYAFIVPSLSILVNALLSLLCLALFLAFIRSISESIQIGRIINSLYKDTRDALEEVKEEDSFEQEKLPDMSSWHLIRSNISGYFDSIVERQMLKTAKDLDITLQLMIPFGSFVNRKDPFFMVSRRLSDEEEEDVFRSVVMLHQEIIVKNYVYGFKQLTEIAVKAMSPGINDPGTAIQAIDKLTDLMTIRLELKEIPVLLDDDSRLRVICKPIVFSELFYFCFSSISNYTTTNTPVMLKLLQMISVVHVHDEQNHAKKVLATALHDATAQFLPTLKGEGDKEHLHHMIRTLLQEMEADGRHSLLMQKTNKLLLETH